MTDNHLLHQAWEAKARELVLDGYQRRDYPNPSVPSTFHKNGEVVILIRPLGEDQWERKTIDQKEPIKI